MSKGGATIRNIISVATVSKDVDSERPLESIECIQNDLLKYAVTGTLIPNTLQLNISSGNFNTPLCSLLTQRIPSRHYDVLFL